MDEPGSNSVELKVQKTCGCGFLWAFEMHSSNATMGKKQVRMLELKLNNVMKSSRGKDYVDNNPQEKQFVAVYVQSWGRYMRGYITHSCHDSRTIMYQVFLIDYGLYMTVNMRDLKKLPDFASVNRLRAQAWKIAIHGVLPIYIEFDFADKPKKKAGKSWNGKDIQYINNVLKSNDTIRFELVKEVHEYKFGIIYVKDPNDTTGTKFTTLQDLLIKNNHAVKYENFSKVIPSIVRHFEKSFDNVSFPFGEEAKDCESSISITDTQSDNESSLSLDLNESDKENNELESSLDEVGKESGLVQVCVQTPTVPSHPSPPRRGRSRGEVFLNLSRTLTKKQNTDSPPVMIGRTPVIEVGQFEDTPKRKTTDSRITPECGPCEERSRYPQASLSAVSTPTQKTEIVNLITPSPEQQTTPRSAGRGAMLHKLMKSYTPSSGSRRNSEDSNYGSHTKSPSTSAHTLSSDIIELSPPSTRVHEISSEIQSPEVIILSSTESIPPNPVSKRTPETIVLSSTETSSLGTSVNAASSVSRRTIDESVSVESLPSDSTNTPIHTRVPEPAPQRPTDTQEIVFQQMEDEQIAFQNRLLDKIMVVGDCQFKPRFHLKEHDLYEELFERLQQLRIEDLIRCQQYMIPAMLTRRHVTLVDGPKSGKTFSCVIALLSLLNDRKFYSKLQRGPGPKAIILCPYADRCEWIYQQCHELTKRKYDSYIENDNIKINVAYGCGKELEKEKLDELVKGYDIVICTPPCLLRLLQIPEMFNFKRLCHLILDEAHTLLDLYTEETVEIMRKAYEVGKRTETGLILPQRVIISNTWIPKIRQIVKDEVINGQGIALFSSYLEAAIFSNLKASLKYLDDSDKKFNDVIDYLNADAAQKNVVVVFDDSDDFYELYENMRAKFHRPVYALSRLHQLIDEEIADWKRDCSNGRYPIMLCNDYVLSDLHIYEADCLIHYSLPDKKSTFSLRFSTILNNLSAPREYLKKGSSQASSKAETLIYLNSDNYEQFPTIVNLMERLHAFIPQKIKNISNKLKNLREQRKGNVAFCENLKKFGRCWNEALCEQRHTFSLDYDQPDSDLPSVGLVKLHIVRVYSATHFCVRLLQYKEHKAGSQWTDVNSIPHPYVVNSEVERYLSKKENRALHVCESAGEVAAIETTSGVYRRVKILKIVEDEKSKKKIMAKVKFLEDGKLEDVRLTLLMKLSDELAAIPASTVDVFLCNLLPRDRDIEWGDAVNHYVDQKIQKLQEHKEKFFVGNIKLVSGRDVWLHPLDCKQRYASINEFTTVYSIYRDLVREKMAVVNEQHLSKLLQLYECAGFTVPEEVRTSEPDPSVILSPKAPTDALSPEPNPREVPVNELSHSESSHESESVEEEIINKKPDVQDTPKEEAEWEINDVEEENNEHDQLSVLQSETSKDDSVPSKNAQSSLDLAKLNELPTPEGEGIWDTNFTEKELKLMIREIMPGILPASESDEEAPPKIIIKPTIDWHQDVANVYINVYLNVDSYTVRLTNNSVYFHANVDNKSYEFDEVLYASINEKTSTHRKSGVYIAIKMEKLRKVNKWNRLLKRKDSQHWVKVNKDYLDSDEEIVPDEYFPDQLCLPPAFVVDKTSTPTSLPWGTIYPEGYEEDEDSDDLDYDAYDDRLGEYCDE